MKPEIITVRELQLADTVQLDSDNYRQAYFSATVKQIKDGRVYLVRPYMITADFSYTGGVICSIGWEDIVLERDSDRKVL